MSTEKMREEFLTWWWHDDRLELRQSCAEGWGIYIWSASRAAIQLEFPQSPYMPDSDPDSMSDYEIGEAQGRCDMWEKCRESVKSLGLKVKP